VLAGHWSRPLRAAGGFFLRPWVAVGLFNAVMIGWHLPGPYDLAENNPSVHIWLMHGSFFAAGVLFWLQFIPSPPFRIRMPLLSQAAALLATNFVMIGIAMALSIFVNGSVYPVYAHVPGVTLPPFADQQIGAAILWVCGDFWALPTMIVIVRRLIAMDGSITAAVEGVLNRGGAAARGGWATGGPGTGQRRPAGRAPWGGRSAAGARPVAGERAAVSERAAVVNRPSVDGES
jgi:Cytochrome c oxidase caa3 assembly factor (Caa3_CtaG)